MQIEKKPKGIVITTSPHTALWAEDCLKSVQELGYPVLVVNNDPNIEEEGIVYQAKEEGNDFTIINNNWNGFELGGIQRGAEFFDEFIHLMDTCVVKDPKMIEEMFNHNGSVYLCRGFFSYLGKYISSIVEKVGTPRVEDKEQAIYHERSWNARYLDNDPNAKQFQPELPVTTDVFEEKNGRKNMVLDNGFIIKYKGTWR